jgi:hypothetical protein
MNPSTLNRLIGLALRAVQADPTFRPVLDALNHARRLQKAGYPAHYVRLACCRALWLAEV